MVPRDIQIFPNTEIFIKAIGQFQIWAIRHKFNLFYDNGGTDMVVTKAAADVLAKLGKARNVSRRKISLTGIGDLVVNAGSSNLVRRFGRELRSWLNVIKLSTEKNTLYWRGLSRARIYMTFIYNFLKWIFSLKYELIGRALPHILLHNLDSPHSGTHGGILVS